MCSKLQKMNIHNRSISITKHDNDILSNKYIDLSPNDLEIYKDKIDEIKFILENSHVTAFNKYDIASLVQMIPCNLKKLSIVIKKDSYSKNSSLDMKSILESKYLICELELTNLSPIDHSRVRLHNCNILPNVVTDKITLYGIEYNPKMGVKYENKPYTMHNVNVFLADRISKAKCITRTSVKYGVKYCKHCAQVYGNVITNECPTCTVVDGYKAIKCIKCNIPTFVICNTEHYCKLCRVKAKYQEDNTVTIKKIKYFMCNCGVKSKNMDSCLVCDKESDIVKCQACDVAWKPKSLGYGSDLGICSMCNNCVVAYEDGSCHICT